MVILSVPALKRPHHNSNFDRSNLLGGVELWLTVAVRQKVLLKELSQ